MQCTVLYSCSVHICASYLTRKQLPHYKQLTRSSDLSKGFCASSCHGSSLTSLVSGNTFESSAECLEMRELPALQPGIAEGHRHQLQHDSSDDNDNDNDDGGDDDDDDDKYW